MDAWDDVAPPDGMLSYTCFVSTDGSTLRHHAQWTDESARSRYFSTATPEADPELRADDRAQRLRTIDETVPGIERDGLAAYDLYRSHLTSAEAPDTGCIVIVTIDFSDPNRDRQARWIDAVVAAIEADPEPDPGLISAHFHRSLDGSQVVNYAQWTSEQAHRDALSHGPDGLAQTDQPLWRRVFEFPGVAGASDVKRYREHRSLVTPPATAP
jgi:hypothetical protein